MNNSISKILILDDEIEITEIISNILDKVGIANDCLNDSSQAIDKITTNSYVAVLSDFSMPGVSGIELLTKVRAKGLEIPFVFLTAHGNVEIVKDALKLGAIDYIQKPFRNEQLVDVVARAMEIGCRQINLHNEVNKEQRERDIKFIQKLRLSANKS